MIQIRQYFKQKASFNSIGFFLVVVLCLGIFLRFSNIEGKVYWNDEVATSIKVAGYKFAEVDILPFKNGAITSQELDKYQYPNSQRTSLDTINALASEEPQLPPLYYLLLRIWIKYLGQSIFTIRVFSVVISLLVIPTMYWLCCQLFDSFRVGWLAILLTSISPIHILYAHEARPYTLWTLTTIISCLALLKALKNKTIFNWIIYSLSLVIGFYTFLFSVFTLISHCIYVIVTEQYKFTENLKNYLFASLIACVMFVPWTIAIWQNYMEASKRTGWTNTYTHISSLIKTWVLNLSRIFIDFNHSFEYKNSLIYLGVILLVGYSIYFLIRNTETKVWLFVLTLMTIPVLSLVLPDLVFGGRRSSAIRYLVPSYIGIEICVAYLLASKIFNLYIQPWQQFLGKIVTIVLVCSGIFSGIISLQSSSWWNKVVDIHTPQAARIINRSERPLVISFPSKKIFTISSLVKENTSLHNGYKLEQQGLEFIDKNYSDIFFYDFKNIDELKSILAKEHHYKINETWEWKQQVNPVHTIVSSLYHIVRK